MNSQWTAQDVERFREQQRWRLRHKTNAPHAHRPHPPADNQMATDDDARARKVSLKFRREHEQFAAKQLQGLALSPRASALAVTLRPAFSVAMAPTATGRARGRVAESPLPHTAYTMFNAFDSAASPEAFALARHDHSNQDEREPSEEDEEMASEHGGEEDQQQKYGEEDEEDAVAGSLWRRRVHVQGMEKRSPKLGRVALWDAAGGAGCSNQAAWVVERMPLPFADDDDEL